MSLFDKNGNMDAIAIQNALQTLANYSYILENKINLTNGTKNHDFEVGTGIYRSNKCLKCGYQAFTGNNGSFDFPSCEEVLMESVLK